MTRTGADRLDAALLRVIAVLLLGGVAGLLNGSIVAVGTETLAATFEAPLSAVGWVTTGYLLAVTVAIPVTAWAGDRFGEKRVWLAGLALFLAGSVASGLAWNLPALIAFRLVMGIGGGVLEPLMLTLLARGAGPGRAGRVMGLMGVVLSLGPVIGPIAGGAILQGLGWRWMFLLNLPITGLALLLSLRVIPAEPAGASRTVSRLDVIGLALLPPGFAALILALSQAAGPEAPMNPATLLPLGVAVVLLAAYGIHARRARSVPPLIDLRLFTRASFTASVTVMSLMGVATFATLFTLPLYYQQVHGMGTFGAGLLVAPFGLGAAIAMPVSGRLSDRFGTRALARGGILVALACALAFTQAGPGTPVAVTALLALVIGLACGFVGAPTMGGLYRTLPADLVPQGSSLLFMLNQAGAALGIAAITLLLGHAATPTSGFRGAYALVAVALLVMLGMSTLLPGRPPAPEPVQPAGTGLGMAPP